MFLFSRRVRLATLSVFLVGLSAAGIAAAAIPDSGTGVIHGCYKTNKGDLRVIDPAAGQACTARETPIKWPGGPSEAFVSLGSAPVPGDGSTVTVDTLSLPTGRYVLSATATAGAGATGPETVVTCFFNAPAANGGVFNSAIAYLGEAEHATVPIVGDLIITSTIAAVDLDCRASGNNLSVDSILTATQVGRIVSQ